MQPGTDFDHRHLLKALPFDSGLVCSNMGLKAGKRIGVKGEISAGAKSFVLNLGKDQANIVLHFNARFDIHGDVRTIVCNSMDKGEWGAEQRESAFPFQEGTNVEIFITHDPSNLTITLPNNHQFKFPNRLGLQVIDFLNAEGDFIIKSIQLE
ncbi:galectin-1 isoform X1 [Chrysemys picta bellii]|uniref:galectin-1 isoform X1 n=1 Tax=Chrysemys picta bellii TaxID=8478 RepID=UPI0032B2BE0F